MNKVITTEDPNEIALLTNRLWLTGGEKEHPIATDYIGLKQSSTHCVYGYYCSSINFLAFGSKEEMKNFAKEENKHLKELPETNTYGKLYLTRSGRWLSNKHDDELFKRNTRPQVKVGALRWQAIEPDYEVFVKGKSETSHLRREAAEIVRILIALGSKNSNFVPFSDISIESYYTGHVGGCPRFRECSRKKITPLMTFEDYLNLIIKRKDNPSFIESTKERIKQYEQSF